MWSAIIALPVFFAFLSDKTKGVLNSIFVGLTLFTPCFFAGVRDYSIGTDVMTYAIWTYNSAASEGLMLFLKDYSAISAPGFNLFSWVFSKAGSFELYLAAIQALTICPLYFYARRKHNDCTWPAIAAYMMLLYPISLNAMKQMIAVAFCLPSYDLIEQKRPILFVAYVAIVGVLFHQTALFFLLLYPIERIISGAYGERKAFFGKGQKLAIVYLVFLGFIAAFLFGRFFIGFFSRIKESYAYLVQSSGAGLNNSALIMTVALLLTQFICMSGMRSPKSQFAQEQQTLSLICIIGSLVFQLSMLASSLLRFSYYFIVFVPIYAASLFADRKRVQSKIAGLLLLSFLVAYFVQVYVLNGGNAVYPYTSAILGLY